MYLISVTLIAVIIYMIFNPKQENAIISRKDTAQFTEVKIFA